MRYTRLGPGIALGTAITMFGIHIISTAGGERGGGLTTYPPGQPLHRWWAVGWGVKGAMDH